MILPKMRGLFQLIGINLSNIIFPFLLVRNRWTGLHYNDWDLLDKIGEYAKNAYAFDKITYKRIIVNYKYHILYHLYKFYHNYILQVIHFYSSYNEWTSFKYSCPGWYKAFGKRFLFELWFVMFITCSLRSVHITDIKEKYGYLHFYITHGNKLIYEVINKYGNKSFNICVKCGKPAEYITSGYISPYCKECCPQDKSIVYKKKVHNKWLIVNDFL